MFWLRCVLVVVVLCLIFAEMRVLCCVLVAMHCNGEMAEIATAPAIVLVAKEERIGM